MDVIMILMWAGWGAFGTLLIMLVYVLLAFVWPARNSAARFFIKGKRTNMPVVALDNGSRWIFKVAEKQAPGLLMDDEGLPIETGPKTLKWGGGVYFGVGEFFRSKLANVTVVDFITRAKAEGWNDEKLIKMLGTVEGLVDDEIKGKEKEVENVRKKETKSAGRSGSTGPDAKGS